jgi:hypothetical protein
MHGTTALASRTLRVLASLLSLLMLASCRGDPTTVLDRLEDSRRLAADLRVKFSKAADSSNRAVMADTEQASLVLVREAEQASQAVDKDVAALETLLGSLSYSRELKILDELKARLAEYRRVDTRILALAAENTNLKAQALSFGPGSQAASSFRDKLRALATGAPAKDRPRVQALVNEAVLAVREIQVLQTPHIAERDDATMTRMEQQMAEQDSKARAALSLLEGVLPSSADPLLAEARSSLDRFKTVSGQLVELSRRNTNLLALDLALRTKPALTAACDERLHALQDALAKEGPKSTR